MTELAPRPAWSIPFVARRLCAGLAMGSAIAATAALLLWITGAYRLEAIELRAPPLIVLGLPLFAWLEELIFRRLLLDWMARWWGRTAGLLISSLIFGCVHAMNPGGLSLAAVVGVSLAGLWLGQLYLQHRRVVACTAAHLAWNAVLGPVLGLPVSGVALGGVGVWNPAAEAWSSGGIFGPEASIFTWLVFVGVIVGLEERRRRR